MLHKMSRVVTIHRKIEQMQQALKTPAGLNVSVAFVLVMLFVMFVVGSSIGGALYAAWVRKRLTDLA